MKNSFLIVAAVFALAQGAFADHHETTSEKVGEAAADTKKTAKAGWRKVKDKTCEMVNGKMECAAKRAKHGMENVGDEVGDKAEDLKKKVD